MKSTPQPVNLSVLCLLALGVGMITGLGAVVFRALVAVIHNLFFLGQFSLTYDANQFTPESPWGMGVILVPVIGGLIVVFLVRRFAPEAKGHGVPEVMDAIYFKQGIIRPKVAFFKALASAFSIGSGASVGREGPIIQIGSALGSTFGQIAPVTAAQRITLVAAGTGAGIAATFNTPVGAVLFATELIMPQVLPQTFLPVVLATGIATYIGRVFIGLEPAFFVPISSVAQPDPVNLVAMACFMVLGVLCGLASWVFISALHRAETLFPKLHKNEYIQNMIGMFIIGIMMYTLSIVYGHYFIGGVGYGTIQSVLQGFMTSMSLLALLFVAKILATSISIGSGASGGVFAPSLFMGATLGGAFGALAIALLPGWGMNGVHFAMVGMAAIVAGATGAPMTAIVMVFEMTRDYNIIVPMIMAVAIAVGVRRMLSSETIYSIKLVARGHYVPKGRHRVLFMSQPASEVMDAKPLILQSTLPLQEAADQLHQAGAISAIVAHDGHIQGVIAGDSRVYLEAQQNPSATCAGVADRRFIIATPGTIMSEVLARLSQRRGDVAVIVSDAGRRGVPRLSDVVGVISRNEIADSILDNMEHYSH